MEFSTEPSEWARANARCAASTSRAPRMLQVQPGAVHDAMIARGRALLGSIFNVWATVVGLAAGSTVTVLSRSKLPPNPCPTVLTPDPACSVTGPRAKHRPIPASGRRGRSTVVPVSEARNGLDRFVICGRVGLSLGPGGTASAHPKMGSSRPALVTERIWQAASVEIERLSLALQPIQATNDLFDSEILAPTQP